jgi:S1-C subfamily serine protease
MIKRAIISTALLTGFWLLWIGGSAADNESVQLPNGLREAFSTPPQLSRASADRVVSVMQGLQKNLILGSTRAEKDVEIYRKNAPGVVLVFTNDSLGSGAVIDAKGFVVTNSHVVGPNREVLVAFKPRDGAELSKDLVYRATVEKIDEVADLALLRINTPPKTLTVFKLGNTSALRVGQDVHAIGHPAGEVWTYTKGIVSQIRDNYEWSGGDQVIRRAKVIQTQTPINPGNSGGPLLDDDGRLIGINSFGRSGGQGLNYAVAVDEIQKFLQRRETRVAQRKETPGGGQDLNCPEAYDTKGQRWSDIVGCYNGRTSPPPELWIVLDAPKSVSYMASSRFAPGKIDILMTNDDPNWQKVLYAVDTNCDGVVDLIGQGYRGRSDLDSYRRPSENLRLVDLATELDDALKTGKIPYPQLRVCQ